MVVVEFRLPVLSEVPGRGGSWDLRRTTELPAVPREGDSVWCGGPDVVHSTVGHVTWTAMGSDRPAVEPDVVVRLEPERRGGLWIEEFESLDALVADHGWEQVGGPWVGQAKG